jgi:phosphopantothenoylcysteine decarboxylase/phosphopantothenate--cysteine ligase|tara:strand:+ start:1995 stop:2564 length:570 start_codon:yes stop_codon:yes gene_type:complete
MTSLLPALDGKQILIGISGGIACYKTAELVSKLVQYNASVHVIMTEAAKRFVAPLTFESLSAQPVFDSKWKHIDGHAPQHIALAEMADIMLVAPCTMDMHAKLANGFADDPISLVCSAIQLCKTPVLLAPSMNVTMLGQASTQRNIQTNIKDGFTVLGTDEGWQACRAEGDGRLLDTNSLVEALVTALQ